MSAGDEATVAPGMRLWAVFLSGLLAGSGCYTTELARPVDFPRPERPNESSIFVRGADRSAVLLDPNTKVRFVIRDRGVSDWIDGRDLWLSGWGASYETSDGTFFVPWNEMSEIEVRNLAGVQTFFAIVGTAIAIPLLLGGGNIAGGRHEGKAPPVVRHPLPHQPGRAHVHFAPAVLATGGGAYPAPAAATSIPPAVGPSLTNQPMMGPEPAAGVQARPLFGGRIRRSSQVEIVGLAQGGLDSLRTGAGGSGSLMLGVRLREAVELAGGVRLIRPPDQDKPVDLAVIGIGHVGAHLWIDDHHLSALCLSLEGGSGYQVVYHVRTSFGLRLRPIPNLSIGFLPFNPTLTQYRDGSGGRGALKFTFPTSLELGLVF